MELADTVDETALRELVETVIGEALERDLCADAAVSESIAQVNSMWRLREEISEAQRADGPHVKHDVSLPIASIPAFLASAGERIDKQHEGVRLIVFGHFGAGNFHYNHIPKPLVQTPLTL